MKSNLKLNEEILLNKQQPLIQNYFRTENKTENKPKLLINKLPSAFSFRSNNNNININNNNIFETPKKFFSNKNVNEKIFNTTYNNNLNNEINFFNNNNSYSKDKKLVPINFDKTYNNFYSSLSKKETFDSLDNNNNTINNVNSNNNTFIENHFNKNFNKPIQLNETQIKNLHNNSLEKKNVRIHFIIDSNNNNNFNINNNNHNFKHQTLTNFLPKIKLDEISNKINENNNNNTNNINNNKNDFELKNFSFENGITYKSNNNYKYYFNIENINLYLLKEIKLANNQNLINEINEWNSYLKSAEKEKNNCYLKIYKTLINIPEDYYTIIMEQPNGETLTDIINSIGFFDIILLQKISFKLYNLIKNNNNNENNIFCPCDIFIENNENIKIIPFLIRNHNNYCQCKKDLIYLSEKLKFKITNNFCLGFLLLKIIFGNISLPSYEYLLNNNNKNIEKKCCLFHTLIEIEDENFNNKFFLLKDLIKIYPFEFEEFLCDCLNFNENKMNINNNWLNLYNLKQKINLNLKEILKIVQNDKNLNKFKNIDDLVNNFEIIYKNLDLNCDYKEYFKKFCLNKKVYYSISKAYDVEVEEFMSKIKNIVYNNNNNNNIDNNNKNNSNINSSNNSSDNNSYNNNNNNYSYENKNKIYKKVIANSMENKKRLHYLNKKFFIKKNINDFMNDKINSKLEKII